jgi:pimeloyl-ACP methyl ester carboxylesterase
MTITPASEPDLSFLILDDGRRIAIRHRVASPGQPTILFLPGYASDMAGQKASAIDLHCASRGLGCLRLDYSGTGQSAGEFAEGTLGRWLDEVAAAIDRAAPDDRLILAGSSMGGWIALLAALRRPARIAALLGIATAPDFTNWGYSPEEKAALLRDGKLEQFNPHGPGSSVTHRGFWQSGEDLRLLDAPIDLRIPVRLVHGMDDGTVPIPVAMKLVEQLASSNVQLRLIKGGGHNLSEPNEIDAILGELDELVVLVDRSPTVTGKPATEPANDSGNSN